MSAEGSLARRSQNDAPWVRITLTVVAVTVISVLVLIPLVNVFAQALSEGFGVYWDNLFNDHDTFAAIKLTLVVAPTALLLNLIFGVTAAWACSECRNAPRAWVARSKWSPLPATEPEFAAICPWRPILLLSRACRHEEAARSPR